MEQNIKSPLSFQRYRRNKKVYWHSSFPNFFFTAIYCCYFLLNWSDFFFLVSSWTLWTAFYWRWNPSGKMPKLPLLHCSFSPAKQCAILSGKESCTYTILQQPNVTSRTVHLSHQFSMNIDRGSREEGPLPHPISIKFLFLLNRKHLQTKTNPSALTTTVHVTLFRTDAMTVVMSASLIMLNLELQWCGACSVIESNPVTVVPR